MGSERVPLQFHEGVATVKINESEGEEASAVVEFNYIPLCCNTVPAWVCTKWVWSPAGSSFCGS